MDVDELSRASERERVLYGELSAVYRDLARVLAAGVEVADPAWITSRNERADAATRELRELAALLGPVRLGGGPVSPGVQELWRQSAALAAEAAGLNARVGELARTRRAEVATRLAELGAGRRALAGYRPAERSGSVEGRRV